MKTLKIQTLKAKGYFDKDEILLHAAFQVLVDFVEQEKPAEIIDWSADEVHRKGWAEIEYLYKWWKEIRPNRIDPLDNPNLEVPRLEFEKIEGTTRSRLLPHDKKKYKAYERAAKESWKLDNKWNAEDQKNLHRLINIRFFLWT